MDELQQAFEHLLSVAKKRFGPTRYKYERVHHSYSRKRHWTSCGGHPEVSREEYLHNKVESSRQGSAAFFGKSKSSYDEYRQSIAAPGYLQELKNMIERCVKEDRDAPEEIEEAQKQQPTPPCSEGAGAPHAENGTSA